MNAQRHSSQRGAARRAAVAVAAAAALLTAGCAAGQQAETAQEVATLDGTNADVGHIALRGLAVLTPSAASYPAGTNVPLRLVIVNNSGADDTLTSVSSPVATGWGAYDSAAVLDDATSSGSPLQVRSGIPVRFGVPAADGHLLGLLHTSKALYPGGSIPVTFTFAKAGSSTIQVPVQLSDNGGATPTPSYIGSDSAGAEG